ncbi:helix-turn-helix domain-containing protein [Deinococcus xinjiangensis]
MSLDAHPQEDELFLVQLGDHIRTLRRARSLGLEPFSDQVGVHRTHLYKIEKGQLNAGILTYLKIARVLDLSLSELFAAIPPEEKSTQDSGQ